MTNHPVLIALLRFAEKRPGISAHNYGCAQTYRREVRRVSKDLKEIRKLVIECIARGVTDEAVMRQVHHRRRLHIERHVDSDTVDVRYDAGQYYPVEYRAAVRAVLTFALEEADK